MAHPTLIVISPQPGGSTGLPNRPSSLISAFIETAAFEEVIVVSRRRPPVFLRHAVRQRSIVGRWLAGTSRRLHSGALLVEHPWPFGRLERRFLLEFIAAVARSPTAGVVVWVSDPKSVPAVLAPEPGRSPWRVVVDAYDAWDRSPLVRGERRRRAVSEGYVAAAARADLIFVNTELMRDRVVELGAPDVRLLRNACPPVDPAASVAGGRPTDLVYVGRIHERFDTGLAAAVADALPEATLTIAGPVEREPEGWPALVARPNVRLRGRMEFGAARELIGSAAAVIVPHRVDDYTRSQDAMKAWDAIASGVPVISTRIPPADAWPGGLAEVCADTEAFVAAAMKAVDGRLDAGRADRLAFAAENQWSDRAAVAVTAIAGLLAAPARGAR
jgi:glycosyltransferase involved in cell wall biosynthesis